MNAKSEDVQASLISQLSVFEDRLDGEIDDMQMLAEIKEGIGRLMTSQGDSEADIRRILRQRYESGDLRKETFQLVQSMLNLYLTENEPTSPGFENEIPAAASISTVRPDPVDLQRSDRIERAHLKQIDPIDTEQNDDPFRSTTVIPVDAGVAPDRTGNRAQIGSVLRDRFMLQERLSGGSMGVVYKALDRRLAEAGAAETWVALKVLSPQLLNNAHALRALQQEAAKGRCLTHPNIVRFIDLDRDDDLYFIVMEWLDGRTLADILDSPDSRSIDTDRALQIVRQIGNALDYAHRCGIVHADVKPGNIMIMPDGEAKLFDFGVARVRQKQMESKAEFDPGVLGLLTPAYSSMQVLTGEDPVPADDVFSLGCLMYRLVAGYRVFGPRNAAEAAEEGLKPQRPVNLDDDQWRTLNKALAFSRVARFGSMAQFVDALDTKSGAPASFEIENVFEIEEPAGSGKWIIALMAFVTLFGVSAYQFGFVDKIAPGFVDNIQLRFADKIQFGFIDDIMQRFAASGESTVVPEISVADARSTQEAAPDVFEAEEAAVVEAAIEDTISGISGVADEPEIQSYSLPLVDFSQLPPPTAEIRLMPGGAAAKSTSVTLREDGAPAVIDIVRSEVDAPLTLRLEEIGFSGNRSPWVSGQYTLTNNGILEFPVGQARARVTLTMTSDQAREADQQSTLRVREADRASSGLATINALLEDDDQRLFEAQLPPNTVAFAMSQASVRERDPAAQIDLQRFNPGNTRLVIGYTLHDVTATEGEDYFAPGGNTISFGPGQRTARLLIPLVQDADLEGDETFVVELSSADSAVDVDIYHRIAVIIRDDES